MGKGGLRTSGIHVGRLEGIRYGNVGSSGLMLDLSVRLVRACFFTQQRPRCWDYRRSHLGSLIGWHFLLLPGDCATLVNKGTQYRGKDSSNHWALRVTQQVMSAVGKGWKTRDLPSIYVTGPLGYRFGEGKPN